MKDDEIGKMIGAVRKMSASWGKPAVGGTGAANRDPFRVLVSCIISLRTKDEVTAAAAERLFRLASDPFAMAKLSEKAVARAIYPAGFYRNKAAQIVELCRRLVAERGGAVPATVEELVRFKGVGRKTANMVVTEGHDRMGICVDIHVHRITNRWGYVKTKNPDATEMALRGKLPRRYWKVINALLVKFGQNICRPVSPRCSECACAPLCSRNGVDRSR